MLFEGGNKGIAMDKTTFEPTIVDLEADPSKKDDVLVHNAADPSGVLGTTLANMAWPQFPVPMGIFRRRAPPRRSRKTRSRAARSASARTTTPAIRSRASWC